MLEFHKDENYVGIKVLGYEFPENNGGGYDSNWLLINLKVASTIGIWEMTHPCLTTWDITSLRQWFLDLSNNVLVDNRVQEFIEPNISFYLLEVSNELKSVQIIFDLEAKPNDFPEGKAAFLIFKLSNTDLRTLANQLNEDCEIYPVRE